MHDAQAYSIPIPIMGRSVRFFALKKAKEVSPGAKKTSSWEGTNFQSKLLEVDATNEMRIERFESLLSFVKRFLRASTLMSDMLFNFDVKNSINYIVTLCFIIYRFNSIL